MMEFLISVGSVLLAVALATVVIVLLGRWETRSNLKEARRQWEAANKDWDE